VKLGKDSSALLVVLLGFSDIKAEVEKEFPVDKSFPNILEERAYAPRMRQMLERFGFRASLAVPLLREDRIIGGLVIGTEKIHRRVSSRRHR